MSEPVSLWKRPLARIAALSFAALFIMAPTPGNVGGCTSVAGSQPVAPGNLSVGETAEYMYFDRGMCAGFCWRLRECGVLCQVMNPAHPMYAAGCQPPPCASPADCGGTAWGRACLPTHGCGCTTDADCGGAHCDTVGQRCQGADNDSPAAYTMCVRGTATPDGTTPWNAQLFHVGECPHACPARAGTYHSAYEWDVQACTDAVLVRSCTQSGPGSIGATYEEGVSECTNVCR